MSTLGQSVFARSHNVRLQAATALRAPYGRSAAFQRLQSQLHTPRASPLSNASLSIPPLRSQFLPHEISVTQNRTFHYASRLQQQAKQPESQEKTEEVKPEDAKKAENTEGESTEKKTEEGQEGEEGEKKEDGKKEAPPPPPPHGDKTPWQVFTETLQSEFKASKEWNDSTKALASSAHQFTESESVRKARQAYEASSSAVSSTTGKVLKTTAGAVGKGAAWTWDTQVVKGVRVAANKTGEVLEKSTRPVRESKGFKAVKNVIDDGSSSRYGGWVEKEERRKARELREKGQPGQVKPQEVPVENPEAGMNVTLHKDAAWKESWRDFRDQSKLMQSLFNMKEAYHESENPFVSTARSITDRVAGFFAENETAKVIKKFREMDPTFQLEPFLRDLREYILPEVLDAYVKGDVATLKLWLSDAQFSVYEALTKQYTTAGLKSDGRILDIRHVDILSARMLEPSDIPVFIITCRTQEVHVYRKVKSGELAAGMEDKVQLVTYAIGITRIPEDVNNPETRGWRLIEMQKSGRDYI